METPTISVENSKRGLTNRFQKAIDVAEGNSTNLRSERWKNRIGGELSYVTAKIHNNLILQCACIWILSALFLFLLAPPIVRYGNENDDLDSYKCSLSRVVGWSAVAPIAFVSIPYIT